MKIIYIILFFLSSFCYGLVVGPVEIHGVVVKYDKKTVTLKNSEGKKIKVSRKSIPKSVKLKTGKKVYALLKPEDIINKKPKKRRK